MICHPQFLGGATDKWGSKKKIKKGFTVIGYGHDIAIFQEAFYQGINKLKNI